MNGVYLILAQLKKAAEIRVRSGRRFVLGAGFYVYVGSALNGLEGRVARHLRRRKKLFWHIDYLLKAATVRAAILAETGKREECFIAAALTERLFPVASFGCSDCRCRSHLFFSPDLLLAEKHLQEILTERGLRTLQSSNLPIFQLIEGGATCLNSGKTRPHENGSS